MQIVIYITYKLDNNTQDDFLHLEVRDFAAFSGCYRSSLYLVNTARVHYVGNLNMEWFPALAPHLVLQGGDGPQV